MDRGVLGKRSIVVRATLRIVCIVTAAGVLAACDRCGDFLPPLKFSAQVCKDEAPRPR
jgi:hypothetical protein